MGQRAEAIASTAEELVSSEMAEGNPGSTLTHSTIGDKSAERNVEMQVIS